MLEFQDERREMQDVMPYMNAHSHRAEIKEVKTEIEQSIIRGASAMAYTINRFVAIMQGLSLKNGVT